MTLSRVHAGPKLIVTKLRNTIYMQPAESSDPRFLIPATSKSLLDFVNPLYVKYHCIPDWPRIKYSRTGAITAPLAADKNTTG